MPKFLSALVFPIIISVLLIYGDLPPAATLLLAVGLLCCVGAGAWALLAGKG